VRDVDVVERDGATRVVVELSAPARPRITRLQGNRAVLTIEEAEGVSSQGVPRGDAGTVLALLSIGWEPGEDGTGRLMLTLAGDGAIAVSVEALEVTLTDVTRPYRAVSGKLPQHPEG